MANRLDGKTQGTLREMWQEACERGESLSFKIASGSMSPMLKVGNVVKVSKVQPSEVRIGDVVAFQDGPYVIVHRVIGKSLSNQQIIFRHMGDAGMSSGYIAAENLIGRVSRIEKEGRAIVLESRRHIMTNRIMVWRLRLVESLVRMLHRHIGMSLRFVLRPVWRLYRSLPLWRL